MRKSLCASACLTAALALVTATAQARALNLEIRTSGSITATWQGDAGRGCAAAGVCGINGSVTYRPLGRLDVEFEDDGSSGASFGEVKPAVVRVQRIAGAQRTTCTDLLPGDVFVSDFIGLEGSRLGASFANTSLSSGRCAGPRVLDLAPALPRGSLSVRSLTRGPRVIDMSGRHPFAAGPFSGAVISTVKVEVSRSGSPSGFTDEGAPGIVRAEGGRGRRFFGIGLSYRVTPLAGPIVTEFAGLHSPACRLLDACGARGRSTLDLRSGPGEIVLFATSRSFKRRPPLRTLLRMVRRGDLRVGGYANFDRMTARVSEDVTLADGQRCSDSLFADVPSAEVRSGGRRIALVLTSAGDSVRTHCPGPTEDDVTHTTVLARASFALRDLGKRSLRVDLGTPRSFSSMGFAGTRRGTLPLELRRTDVFDVTERVSD